MSASSSVFPWKKLAPSLHPLNWSLRLCAEVDAKPDCSIGDLLKSFSIVDAVEFLAETLDALKQETVSAYLKAS
ncbi:hypothetical protein SK128_010423 [Halocaridina rubra]|uniref:Uncharacterized protein n=1 Tax=Halocaridina rubra TaxID=373956 RepID=A0AAN8WAM4_HALRR